MGLNSGAPPETDMDMTRRSLTRRASLLGFTAGALALSMTGSAYACTFFYGKVTVTTTRAGYPNLIAFTDGAGSGSSTNPLEEGGVHGYCPVPAPADNFTDAAVSGAYPAQGAYKAATFKLDVGKTTTCVKNNSLVDAGLGGATFRVRWLNMNKAVSQICVSAANDAPGISEDKGSITLMGGVGSGVFNQGTAAVGDQVKVCIRDTVQDRNTGVSAPDVKLLMI